MTRSLAPRSLSSSSAGWRRRRPVHRTKAQRRSTVLADSISVRSSAARFGSSLLLVSSADSLSLVVGRRSCLRFRVSRRWREWSWVGPAAIRSVVFSSWRRRFASATRSPGLAAVRARRTASATLRARISGASSSSTCANVGCSSGSLFSTLPSASVLRSSYNPSGSRFVARPPMKLVTSPGYCPASGLPNVQCPCLSRHGLWLGPANPIIWSGAATRKHKASCAIRSWTSNHCSNDYVVCGAGWQKFPVAVQMLPIAEVK